ncbi:hypothetical protein RND71_000903 [Anisodus tanguticus]|uniref:Uncharacterized protein n=1 Tax=Anisodus tanguticus TaxID=243964 RepID=A0AAE1T1Z9_9SOLA|nr:hypothetical protein RND71_000903 [Anisodus tanguticus]
MITAEIKLFLSKALDAVHATSVDPYASMTIRSESWWDSPDRVMTGIKRR